MLCSRRKFLQCAPRAAAALVLGLLVLTASPAHAAGTGLVANLKGSALAANAAGKARFRLVNGRQVFQVDGDKLTGFKEKYVVLQIVRGATTVNLGRTRVNADGTFALAMGVSTNTIRANDTLRLVFQGQVLASGRFNPALN